MKEKINEEFICVLRKDKQTNQFEVDYVKIETPFSKLIGSFSNLCDDPNYSLQQIINFIKTNRELDKLTKFYKYCSDLNGSYQAFSANNQNTITEIIKEEEAIFSKKKNSKKYDIDKAINDYKQQLKEKYILWAKAYSIDKTYRLCDGDKSILTFSHRIDGWANPVYQLTTNFSVEIKTNFGYGNSSYFYTILKYKNIKITPFSEWIRYEFAKFSQIIRYTQKHTLLNEYWLEAMEYSRDACNLSLIDEKKFVEEYIIKECETMVNGLEEILTNEQFSFTHRKEGTYSIDKEGHVLIEFRGEKISGALDFISKLLELEEITSIKHFIDRIEICNKIIQPILADESKILKIKISDLTKERNILIPNYNKIIKRNDDYDRKKSKLEEIMIKKGQLNYYSCDYEKLENEFNNKYPNYKEFLKEYKQVTEAFRILTEQIQNFIKVHHNIAKYNKKIIQHFEKQK